MGVSCGSENEISNYIKSTRVSSLTEKISAFQEAFLSTDFVNSFIS
jgi:hypothetical protein